MLDIIILATNTTLKTDCNTKICEIENKITTEYHKKILKT